VKTRTKVRAGLSLQQIQQTLNLNRVNETVTSLS
jgi:hypothetical protein